MAWRCHGLVIRIWLQEMHHHPIRLSFTNELDLLFLYEHLPSTGDVSYLLDSEMTSAGKQSVNEFQVDKLVGHFNWHMAEVWW